MGSYVISVSPGTDCYRHIQISKSATLYRLHQAIICAFDFEDDHQHAFFMDNKYWSDVAAYFSSKTSPSDRLTKKYQLQQLQLSPGHQFKYVFDFGNTWRFQCKVLRELESKTDIPGVIRRVGQSPEQYPDLGEWLAEDEPDGECLPPATQQQIDALINRIPLPADTILCIHQYMDAAVNLYGLISLAQLRQIYNSQNAPVSAMDFAMAAVAITAQRNPYRLVFRGDLPPDTVETTLNTGELIADYLFADNPARDIRELRRQQSGKPYKLLPRDEMLRHADPDYFPPTPQQAAMLDYLRRKGTGLPLTPEFYCSAFQSIMVIDAPLREVISIGESAGLHFSKDWDKEEFTALYQSLCNATHRHANRGYTPNELLAADGQTASLDQPPSKPKLTLLGQTPPNTP